MSVLSLIGDIFKPAADLVDNLHTSAEEKGEIKAKLDQIALDAQSRILDFVAKMAEQQANVIISEQQSQDKWVRMWRPVLMYLIMAIIAVKYLVEPLIFSWLFPSFEGIILPEQLFTLLQIGVGGYVIGRSGEKMVGMWKNGR